MADKKIERVNPASGIVEEKPAQGFVDAIVDPDNKNWQPKETEKDDPE